MTCMAPVNALLDAPRSFDERPDRIIADIGELNRRVTSIEGDMKRLRRQDRARLETPLDRVESRLDGLGHALDGGGADQ